MSTTNEGWTIEHGTATRVRPGHETTVELDSEHVGVAVEQGSGYLGQQTTTLIPVGVLVELLRGAGWVVTRGGTNTEEAP